MSLTYEKKYQSGTGIIVYARSRLRQTVVVYSRLSSLPADMSRLESLLYLYHFTDARILLNNSFALRSVPTPNDYQIMFRVDQIVFEPPQRSVTCAQRIRPLLALRVQPPKITIVRPIVVGVVAI